MRLSYSLNGTHISTSESDSNVQLTIKKNENHFLCKVKALNDITLISALEESNFEFNPNDTFFINGYQSWTATQEVPMNFKERNCPKFKILKQLVLRPYGDYEFYKTEKGKLHSYDVFYTKGNKEIFVLSNNFKNAFLIVELFDGENILNFRADIEGKNLAKGQDFIIFDFEIFNSYKEGIECFNKKYPLRNIPKIFGYTSWYNYYQDINEEIILRDLNALDDRFDLFQIDDGYETYVGDWMDIDPKKFPNGLAPIVEKIHSRGFKAGLWLAPFVAERESHLFKTHPEYFKKDKDGNPIQVGVNWSGQFALDLDNPEVLKYIEKCLTFYKDMGFDLFKLDFIYSSAYTHEGVTRAEASEKSYKFLKDVLKDKLILGCGATLPSVYQNFDYVRVGPDVSLSFDDKLYMRLLHRERPSTKFTIQNTVYRHFMNDRWFANDPDVFLLRDENIKLTLDQRKGLTTMNALFGSLLMTSDNIATYDEEKKKILNYSLVLFKQAKNINFVTKGDVIHVTYEIGDSKHDFDYLVNKGVIRNDK